MRPSPLLAAAALGLLAACQTGQPDTERNPLAETVETSAATGAALPAATVERLLTRLRGVWVQQAYLEAVGRTRSPQQASRRLAEIAELHISPRDLRHDTLAVGVNLNNHEGAQLLLRLRATRHPHSLPLDFPEYAEPGNYYELDYGAPSTADSVLVVNKYNAAHRLLSAETYRRVALPPSRAGREEDLSTGLEYAVNRLLLAGRFAGQDSAGRPISAHFQPDGDVHGWPGFRHYAINTDFAAGPENNLDLLTFNAYSPQQRSFTFRLTQDTLRLYALRPSPDHIDLLPARLHYTLVRQR